ncbi:MAG: hypothetical protein K0R39_546 [Symbiobacteriaceae bacterium]|nr:hypothetical protein [Symbiobacteriaceae bacterium]
MRLEVATGLRLPLLVSRLLPACIPLASLVHAGVGEMCSDLTPAGTPGKTGRGRAPLAAPARGTLASGWLAGVVCRSLLPQAFWVQGASAGGAPGCFPGCIPPVSRLHPACFPVASRLLPAWPAGTCNGSQGPRWSLAAAPSEKGCGCGTSPWGWAGSDRTLVPNVWGWPKAPKRTTLRGSPCPLPRAPPHRRPPTGAPPQAPPHRRPPTGRRQMMASASISTSMSGSISRLTSTMVATGRMVRKNSPCARPMASAWSMLVTYMRVRTTS